MPAQTDPSNGYEAVASEFVEVRRTSEIGLGTVRKWANQLPANAAVLDLGCGAGFPVSVELSRLGFRIAGIDASPTLIAEFRRVLPEAPWACEPVEHSTFFGRKFDAIVAIGLMFLLPEETQRSVITKAANVLEEGGRFLFTAPHQACSWLDVLTGQTSTSLGAAQYETDLRLAGMAVTERYVDEGENHYFACCKM
jgi:2-polyprenyl-3-methyl-5-hydroxy-6-metoxy-1,4-benzoquinol methylase